MDDRSVLRVRRALGAGFAVLAALMIVLVLVAVRGSSPSKAERLHSVRSVALAVTSCPQWGQLTEDVQWVSAYRELSTMRYEAAARNRQPGESEVDRLVEGIRELCAIPLPDGSPRTAEAAAIQVVAEQPDLLSSYR